MTTTTALTDEQAQGLELLRNGKSFVLVGHVRPDGDCIGAQASLARVLLALGRTVVVLNPDTPDATFSTLTAAGPFQTYEGGALPEHDVCVLLDINDLERCGALTEPLRAAPSRKLVVDHHVFHGEPWWDASYVDVGASATGLLVWRIAKALGYEPDGPFAEAVFTSLATDTGWFKYSNTDAETMAVAAELVRHGVVPFEVFGRLHQRRTPEFLSAVAGLLARVQYHGGGRIAVVDEPLDAFPLADSDAILDLVRAVQQVEVVLYLKELEGGMCKLSARSKTTYDVNALARRFGGGGHVKASGATIQGTLPEVSKRVTEAALEAL